MGNRVKQTKRSKRQSPKSNQGSSQLSREGDETSVQMQIPIGSSFHLKQAFGDLLTQAGLLLINAFINDEVDRLAGPRYAHDDGHQAYRHGTAEGHVNIAGKKVAIDRPRLRDEQGEVPLSAYQLFSDPRALNEAAYQQMMLGISTRDYRASIEALGDGYGIEKSSVSRNFQAASARALRDLAERPLTDFDGSVIMIDGVHFADTVFVIALGINENGCKQVLGLWSGGTENSDVVGGLLEDLVARGLSQDRRYLFVIDGSKALAKGITSRFGKQADIQRCRVHKKKNILEHTPKKYHSAISLRFAAACSSVNYDDARRELEKLHVYLEGINTHAARSLEEAFEELLTVQRIGVPPQLQPYLSNTNMIENLFSLVRKNTRNVKNWKDKPAKNKPTQDMRQRWVAAGLTEAEKSFNRVRHYRHLPEVTRQLQGIDETAQTA